MNYRKQHQRPDDITEIDLAFEVSYCHCPQLLEETKFESRAGWMNLLPLSSHQHFRSVLGLFCFPQ